MQMDRHARREQQALPALRILAPGEDLNMSTARPPHMQKPCKDCPFRKDSLEGWLGEERMRNILKQSSFVCHKKHERQCAGHMLLVEHNAFVQVAARMGIPLKLDGRDLVFDTESECIAHHAK